MKILVISGAGLSAPSGMPTFVDGLWQEYRVEEVATHEAWLENPKRVIEFFDQRRQELARYQPNAAHRFLAKLPNSVHLTQNVDDLCQRAGDAPIHLHGRLRWVRCEECGKRWDIGYAKQPRECPWCKGVVRPDVVLFGEIAPNYRHLYTTKADLFIAIGTSGRVIDIADLAKQFPRSILVNPKREKRVTMFGEFEEYIDEYFTHFIQKSAEEAVEDIQKFLKEL